LLVEPARRSYIRSAPRRLFVLHSRPSSFAISSSSSPPMAAVATASPDNCRGYPDWPCQEHLILAENRASSFHASGVGVSGGRLKCCFNYRTRKEPEVASSKPKAWICCTQQQASGVLGLVHGKGGDPQRLADADGEWTRWQQRYRYHLDANLSSVQT